ncbi:MAG: Cytochrome c peroxidase family protein [Bryobacterales bacterium]|nr:Cytochrome c peroxidase family protein [Bryobacterales bacterium]
MKRTTLLATLIICAGIGGTVFLSTHPVAAQVVVPPYSPYPPGIILPNDLVSEIARVRREVSVIFNQAIGEWRALPPATLSGLPPTIQGSGYTTVQTLGKLLNFDENMSVFKNRACAFCHMPYAGFSGPIPSVNLTMVAYPGSYEFRAGKRTAQRYTYSPRYPVLQFNQPQGLFVGGNFWDGRSTGYLLQSADAEQAQHPPVDSQEHGLPDTACIAYRLTTAVYRPLFETVWGVGSLNITFPANTDQICSTPAGAAVFAGSATPIQLTPEDRTKANSVYNHWGQSISFFEDSPEVSPFTSKVDYALAGLATLSPDEIAGRNLFRGKGNCNSCHLDGQSTLLTPGQTDTGTFATNARPLFTCFGYSNLGLPLNPRDAILYQSTPDFFGFTANPFGFAYRDLGLGTFLRSGPGSAPNPNSTWTQYAPRMDGRQQVSTVRNVAMTPPQCPTTEAPGPYFQKEFFHNGYIKSLKQLVHFYNTRDKFPFNVTSGHCPAGTIEKVDCWPMPEVTNNMDMTVGNLNLTDAEENLIVTVMTALTDGYNPANPNVSTYPNINTFTGACSICNPANPNCSPSRQGNEFLIPTPPLPPCASGICGVAPLPTKPIP